MGISNIYSNAIIYQGGIPDKIPEPKDPGNGRNNNGGQGTNGGAGSITENFVVYAILILIIVLLTLFIVLLLLLIYNFGFKQPLVANPHSDAIPLT